MARKSAIAFPAACPLCHRLLLLSGFNGGAEGSDSLLDVVGFAQLQVCVCPLLNLQRLQRLLRGLS